MLVANQIMTIVKEEVEAPRSHPGREGRIETLEILEELTSRFCHEINNSLAILRGAKELLTIRESDRKECDSSLQLISKAINRIENLTQGFHVLANFEDGDVREFCLHRAIDQSLAVMDIIYNWKGFNVKKKLEAKECQIRVPQRQLVRVIMSVLSVFWNNLLVNKQSSLTIETTSDDENVYLLFWDQCYSTEVESKYVFSARIPHSMIEFSMSIIKCHEVVKAMGGSMSLLNRDDDQKKYQITLPLFKDEPST